jgi:hypothetical protein
LRKISIIVFFYFHPAKRIPSQMASNSIQRRPCASRFFGFFPGLWTFLRFCLPWHIWRFAEKVMQDHQCCMLTDCRGCRILATGCSAGSRRCRDIPFPPLPIVGAYFNLFAMQGGTITSMDFTFPNG